MEKATCVHSYQKGNSKWKIVDNFLSVVIILNFYVNFETLFCSFFSLETSKYKYSSLILFSSVRFNHEKCLILILFISPHISPIYDGLPDCQKKLWMVNQSFNEAWMIEYVFTFLTCNLIKYQLLITNKSSFGTFLAVSKSIHNSNIIIMYQFTILEKMVVLLHWLQTKLTIKENAENNISLSLHSPLRPLVIVEIALK